MVVVNDIYEHTKYVFILPTIALLRITLYNSIDNHVTKKLLEQLVLRTVKLIKH